MYTQPGQQTGAKQANVKFPIAVKHNWGDDGHKYTANDAADRDGQIEGCQSMNRWLQSRKFTVAYHASNEKNGRIKPDLYQYPCQFAKENKKYNRNEA